jgi:DNA polymerase I-like protein with 3'-5' exonuclease and polymerase domains
MGSVAAIRHFDAPLSQSEEAAIQREGMNARIQMTGACIMKHAVYLILKERETLDYPVKFVLTVHDAIVTTVPEEYAEQWAEKQKELMIQASKTIVPSVHIGVDCNISKFWKA